MGYDLIDRLARDVISVTYEALVMRLLSEKEGLISFEEKRTCSALTHNLHTLASLQSEPVLPLAPKNYLSIKEIRQLDFH